MDIVTSLIERNLDHAVEGIVCHLDFQSILAMHKVCTIWNDFLTLSINPWQVMLKQRMKTNPSFEKACDLNDWTKYIMTPDPVHRQRIKYIAYVGTFISEKQRLLRESFDGCVSNCHGSTSEFTLNEEGEVRAIDGWWFVANNRISAWSFSAPDAMRPEKVFQLPDPVTSSRLHPMTSQTIVAADRIDVFTTDNEFKPWKKLVLVAAGCTSDHARTGYQPHYWVVWSFETSAVLRRIPSQHEICMRNVRN